jgi:hypothetical protein
MAFTSSYRIATSDAGIRIMEHCSQAGKLKAPPRAA